MKPLHWLVSALTILLLVFLGSPWLLRELDLLKFYGLQYKQYNFFLLDLSIPFLLIFLILYNLGLIKDRSQSWIKIGLVVSEIGAIVGLALGLYSERGGFNAMVAQFFFIPLILQLLTTLTQIFFDKQFSSQSPPKSV